MWVQKIIFSGQLIDIIFPSFYYYNNVGRVLKKVLEIATPMFSLLYVTCCTYVWSLHDFVSLQQTGFETDYSFSNTRNDILTYKLVQN